MPALSTSDMVIYEKIGKISEVIDNTFIIVFRRLRLIKLAKVSCRKLMNTSSCDRAVRMGTSVQRR